MQHEIDPLCAHGLASMPSGPSRSETQIISVTAFGAGPVARGEGGSVVEEEQFRVGTTSHERASPVTELCAARYPPAPLSVAHDAPFAIVQDAAIAHQEPAPDERDDFTKRGDAVLPWHVRRPASPIGHEWQ
jgi:hypothetical protein